MEGKLRSGAPASRSPRLPIPAITSLPAVSHPTGAWPSTISRRRTTGFAYLSIRISASTTVDHYVPKCRRSDLVYERTKLPPRVPSDEQLQGRIPSCPRPLRTTRRLVRPEPVEVQVVRGARLPQRDPDRVQGYQPSLALEHARYCRVHSEYAEARWNADIPPPRRPHQTLPLVARQLHRQGRMHR